MGAMFRLPFATVRPWPAALADLPPDGWEVVALTPGDAGLTLESWAPALRAHPRVALLVGSEGPGLTEAAVAVATGTARIPMSPGVDSLNVAVAAAIALYALRPGG
jgi:tRNA G18 (ribose-2'-O)-methylase SpoU